MASVNDAEDYYTLLGVRADGVASVIEVLMAPMPAVRHKADALLAEHASCVHVEVWKGATLIDQFARA
ncbi:hypothetical protein [Phenylobacterium sp.]|uniref:hypothetical protein n=1 Tax=Phenylobacterium sp. TaxID=1871053 RepID=UPI002732A0BB|nr:hypothetical protein [Phenylobacterium sp.]